MFGQYVSEFTEVDIHISDRELLGTDGFSNQKECKYDKQLHKKKEQKDDENFQNYNNKV